MHHGRDSELALLERAQKFLRLLNERRPVTAGLVESWDRFYDHYSEVIRHFAYRQGIRGIDADDCEQEVWYYVIRALPDFRPPRNRLGLRAWLYRIVVSVVSSFYRSRRKTPGKLPEPSDGQELPAETNGREPGSSEPLNGSTTAGECVSEMRRQSSPLNCRVVEMRFLEGRSVDEVAEELGLSTRQVWYRQHRTLEKIRRWAKLQNGSDRNSG